MSRLDRIDMLGGSWIVNVVPCPTVEVRSNVPRSFLMLDATMSMPMPRPDTSVTCCAVEKPGAKINRCASAGDMRVAAVR